MKSQIIRLAFLFYIAFGGPLSCTNSAKSNNAQSASDGLTGANDTIDKNRFKAEEKKTLTEYNNEIAGLKKRFKKGKHSVQKQYSSAVDKLQHKSDELDSRLNLFAYKGEVEWNEFKHDFNREMDSLGKSISKMAEKNMQRPITGNKNPQFKKTP